MLYIVPWTHNISYCSTSNVHVTFYNGHYQSPTVFGVYWKNNSEPLLMPCNSERYIRNIRFRNCHVFYSHFIFVWQSNAFPSLTIVSSVQMRGKGLGGGPISNNRQTSTTPSPDQWRADGGQSKRDGSNGRGFPGLLSSWLLNNWHVFSISLLPDI